ncbi:MAG TPA: TonB-dependent receptor, partial [Thermoanaerobaculia bacterium]|nr:TonB-dependent receptor [Thermoanaerobaculia bacterium]
APGWSMRTETEASVWDEQLEARFRGGWTAGVDAYQRGWDATTRMVGAGGMRVMRSLPDTSLDMLALWARHERPLTPALRLRAGARVESAAGSADPALADTALYLAYHGTTATSHRDTYASGHLGLVWQPVPAWELSATLGRAVRPPGPEERYFALRRMGTDWVGDPGLDPAVNHQLELGLRFQRDRIAGNLDAWYSEVDGYITVVEVARQQPVPGVMNPRARSWANQDVRMWGAEASVTLDLGAGLALAATGSFTRGERDLDRARGIVDRDLAEMPAASGRLTLRWERAAWLAEAEGVAAARQERVDASLLEEATPGWAVANLRGGWQGARFSVLAGVENLFDRQYREHLSYQRDPFRSGARVPEPGLAWTVSVRWRV